MIAAPKILWSLHGEGATFGPWWQARVRPTKRGRILPIGAVMKRGDWYQATLEDGSRDIARTLEEAKKSLEKLWVKQRLSALEPSNPEPPLAATETKSP